MHEHSVDIGETSPPNRNACGIDDKEFDRLFSEIIGEQETVSLKWYPPETHEMYSAGEKMETGLS